MRRELERKAGWNRWTEVGIKILFISPNEYDSKSGRSHYQQRFG
jgi:hypothetical protein